jgi:hypothetical protein
VILLIALSMAAGQIAQSISSWTEKLQDRYFQGQARDRLLTAATKTEDQALVERVLPKIRQLMGREADPREAFAFAEVRARCVPYSRTERFNALYAYHRNMVGVLLIMLVNFAFSMAYGGVREWPYQAAILVGLVVLLALQWYRSRKRAEYHAREVLTAFELAADSEIRSQRG